MHDGGLHDFASRARSLGLRDQLDSAAAETLAALESAEVGALLLKGPVLAQRLYRRGEIRGYSDIDLLVPPRDLAAARDALIALGFSKENVHGIDDVANALHAESWARVADGDPVSIDLHWRLEHCDAPGDLVWDVLAKDRALIELDGRQVPVPGDDGLALHLALHAYQHGPSETKAMADLSRGIERWPEATWRRAARLAGEARALPAFAGGLRLVPAGIALATQLNLPPTPELEWEMSRRDTRPRGAFHLEAIARAQGPREYLSVLRRSLIPTRRWIEWEFPWARNQVLLGLAYACHLLRAPIWAARAARFLRSSNRDPAGRS